MILHEAAKYGIIFARYGSDVICLTFTKNVDHRLHTLHNFIDQKDGDENALERHRLFLIHNGKDYLLNKFPKKFLFCLFLLFFCSIYEFLVKLTRFPHDCLFFEGNKQGKLIDRQTNIQTEHGETEWQDHRKTERQIETQEER